MYCFIYFSQVAWNPYIAARAQHPFHQISFFCGCWISLDVIEPYHPHKVLRQFGFVQTILPAPLGSIRASRGFTAEKYKVSYKFLDQCWVTWEDHILSVSHRGHWAQHVWECASDYLEWFCRISHPRVQNPDRHSQYDPNEGRDDPTPRTVRVYTFSKYYVSISPNYLKYWHISLFVTDPSSQWPSSSHDCKNRADNWFLLSGIEDHPRDPGWLASDVPTTYAAMISYEMWAVSWVCFFRIYKN